MAMGLAWLHSEASASGMCALHRRFGASLPSCRRAIADWGVFCLVLPSPGLSLCVRIQLLGGRMAGVHGSYAWVHGHRSWIRIGWSLLMLCPTDYTGVTVSHQSTLEPVN